MTTDTLMQVSGMNERQIADHKGLVAAGYTVREEGDGYYLRHVEREILRGPFRQRELAWKAAEGIEKAAGEKVVDRPVRTC